MKRSAAFALALVLFFAAVPHAQAAAGVIHTFRISPHGGGYSDPDTVKWCERDGEYYIFLPSDADLNDLTVHFRANFDVYAGRVRLTDGEPTFAFRSGGRFTLRCGNTRYILNVMKGSEIPSLFITTSSGSMNAVHRDKEYKEPGSVLICDGGETASLELEYIKGRGNSTWTAEKKPYTIKLKKKHDLFGMGEAKKWVLLASVYDHSFMRSTASFTLASELGIEFTTPYRYVDLWTNGDYRGLYILCEKVETGKNRVDIADLAEANEKANPGVEPSEAPQSSVGDRSPGARKWVELENDPEDITGGYLLEADFQIRYDLEPGGFESPLGMNITIIEPKYPTKAETDYIADYYAAAEEALYSPTGVNGEGRHYSSYFDIDSFARSYLLNEYVKNIDGGQSSFYIYKDANSEKMYAAPAWDFDLSMGNYSKKIGLHTSDPNEWYNNLLYFTIEDSFTEAQSNIDTVLCAMWRKSAIFREAVRREWSNLRLLVTDDALTSLADDALAVSASAVMNARRWGYLSELNDAGAAGSFAHEISSVVDFLKKRREALETAFSPDGAMLLYDPGDGEGHVLDATMYTAGDAATVKGSGSTRHGVFTSVEGMSFAGWNTERDGTGIAYREGDEIVLARGVTTLYAQWAPEDDARAVWARSAYDDGETEEKLNETQKKALRIYEIFRQSIVSARNTVEAWAIGCITSGER